MAEGASEQATAAGEGVGLVRPAARPSSAAAAACRCSCRGQASGAQAQAIRQCGPCGHHGCI